MEPIRDYVEWIALAAMALSLLLVILVLVMQVRLSKLRKRYKAMMGGGRPEDLEQLIAEMREESNRLRTDLDQTKSTLLHWQERVREMKGYTGIYRYNAYGERGNDLSFSIAIMDEAYNGLVMSGIHNREGTYLYAKPVERGESAYKLSPEEKLAMERALEGSSGAGRESVSTQQR